MSTVDNCVRAARFACHLDDWNAASRMLRDAYVLATEVEASFPPSCLDLLSRALLECATVAGGGGHPGLARITVGMLYAKLREVRASEPPGR